MKASVGGGPHSHITFTRSKKINTNRQLLIRNNESQKTMECIFKQLNKVIK